VTSRAVRRIAAAAAAFAAGLAVWAVLVEPARLVVHSIDVAAPGWPAELAGWRVVALSDIHAGAPHMGLDQVRRAVGLANAQAPDLVVLLGDYVIHGIAGGRFVPPEDLARELAALRARHGVVSVLGNHDAWFDAPRVRRAFEAAGLRPLENASVPIDVRGHTVWVAGLADLWTGRPDVQAALADVPAGAPVIVLTHNPDVFPTIPSRVSLTLAGHTHGGQVAIPLLGRPIVPSRYGQRYAFGLVREDDRLLYVTPGLGTSIIPVRLGVPPEISVLRIVARPPAR
jgi:predicted MPP superfamily phosphohydrolase